MERTFIDKVFAICNHALSGEIKGYSRHIYDLNRSLTKIKLDNELKKLARKIRYERKENERYLIEQGNGNIPAILQEIIDKEICRKDYEAITEKVIFDNIFYFEAIKSLDKIIASGVFENEDEYI